MKVVVEQEQSTRAMTGIRRGIGSFMKDLVAVTKMPAKCRHRYPSGDPIRMHGMDSPILAVMRFWIS
jgi:hypothetical protein